MREIAEIIKREDLDRTNPWIVWAIFDREDAPLLNERTTEMSASVVLSESKDGLPPDNEKALYRDITKVTPRPQVGWRYNPKADTFSQAVQPSTPTVEKSGRTLLTRGEFWGRITDEELDAALATSGVGVLLGMCYHESPCDVKAGAVAVLVWRMAQAKIITDDRAKELLEPV